MKKNSLVAKLLGTFTLIIGISFIIIATTLSVWFQNYFFNQRKIQLDNQGKPIAAAYISHLKHPNPNLNELMSIMNVVSNSIESDIVLVDSMGYVYAVTNPLYKDLEFTRLNMRMDLLSKGHSYEEKGILSKKVDQEGYIYYKPIFYGDTFKGVIVTVTPLEKIKAPLRKVYAIVWITALMALIISTIIIRYVAQKMLVKPIGEINLAAKRLAKGDVDKRVVIKSNDEIGELASSFNTMADSIQKVENNRREFISNVSHELRSPITSIKGFIAGILDGVIPRDKENYYLKIVYEEIQRLTRLINDLLDLSSMQAGKLKLNISEFNINELLKQCVMSTEQKIKDRKLRVDVVLEGEHLYVKGDRDRIVQVVTNLIDNAIKYGYENGKLQVKSKTKGDKVLVSVFNEGDTMSEEQKKLIWQRFYKSDKSRTNKISTGLGLPIVRYILTLHNQDIWVENESQGKGVIFTFTLSKIN
ncbi:sensor histidine kinase [Clostridium fallax]|uniref:histidine kinase n=1 Tax=Clostridium fallax TaxID=1533 RepID=A0A1M4TDS1_9CLOT|nr:HAMP domain-containing sensor histidine kinase [Clostridium fallax]SHE42528.1 Signal transduction histidine kinase [Clostridium fallax]SQB22714.1 sensor histidine kinase [Clostridium fallax]